MFNDIFSLGLIILSSYCFYSSNNEKYLASNSEILYVKAFINWMKPCYSKLTCMFVMLCWSKYILFIPALGKRHRICSRKPGCCCSQPSDHTARQRWLPAAAGRHCEQQRCEETQRAVWEEKVRSRFTRMNLM